MAAGPRRRARHRRRARAARQLATMLRGAGVPAISGVDTRALARHLRETAAARASITAPGDVRPAVAVSLARAVTRWEDQDFVGQVSPAAVTTSAPPGPAARRGRRLRPEDEHRPLAAAARRAGTRAPAHASAADVLAADVRGRRLLAGTRRPGAARRPGRARPGGDRRRPAAARHLPGPPDRGARRGRGDDPAALRPPRREPSGPGPRLRLRPGHGAEPRGGGRRRVAAGDSRLPRQPAQPQRRLRRGAAPRDQPIETVQYHPEGSPGPARRARGLRPLRAACRRGA